MRRSRSFPLRGRKRPAPAGRAGTMLVACRGGTTLVEVLMSLMVMGIGVVAVATLFPASVLRSVQATQLTNATILRYNAEGLLTTFPELLTEVTPTTPGTAVNAVVDPAGAFQMAKEDVAYRTVFGRLRNGNPGTFKRVYTTLFPTTSTDSEKAALKFCALPDSWVSKFDPGDIREATITSTQATIPTRYDLSSFTIRAAGASLPSLRIVIFDPDENTSVTREITEITGQVVKWTEDLNGNNTLDGGEDFNRNGVVDTHPLPSTILSGASATARVRIEELETGRYSWLMTVRKDAAGVSNVDIVVFFRRAFSLNDEQIYDQGRYLGAGRYSVNIGSLPKPNWKKGGYLFDVANARWHRIQKVDAATSEVVVEGNPSAIGTAVMFPRGVIEVYPIGNRLP